MKLQRLKELALEIINSDRDNTSSIQQRWRKEDEFNELVSPANILPFLESYEELLVLLKVSACPICDGQGAFYDGHGQVCQCQFCDERAKAITNAEKLK